MKIEPFDSSIVYVCLENIWHVCRSTNAVVHDALPFPELLERTAEHQQLRHLAASLAQEAQQAAYEEKKSRLAAVMNKNQRSKQATSKSDQTPLEQHCVEMDDIDDLLMEDDPA